MTFKITVKTLTGNILKFNKVKDYRLEHGLITFFDRKSGKIKRFPPQNVEIDHE